jgi:hypothetical protein
VTTKSNTRNPNFYYIKISLDECQCFAITTYITIFLLLEFEHMLPCKKTKAYLEMEVECKLASQEQNSKKEVLVVNSKISKKEPFQS